MTPPRTTSTLGAALGALALALGALQAMSPAVAADFPIVREDYSEYGVQRRVDLGIGKSVVIEIPRDAAEVIVGDPEVANAIVRSARRAFLIGVAGGATSVIFIDADGNQIVSLDVNVARDTGALLASLRSVLPEADIDVRPVGDSVLITGSVKSPADSATASDLAGQFVGDKTKVINSLAIAERDQVMLKVTVAEVQRNVAKQLGINWDVNYGIGSAIIGFGSNPAFPFNDALTNIINPDTSSNPGFATTPGGNGLGLVGRNRNGAGVANLRALEENGVLRMLAEPNLTAISGEQAKFLAGGEFPIIAGLDPQTGLPLIEFKEFGVALDFTPVVLNGGRISLRVKTEVSEISTEATVTLNTGENPIEVPGVRTRRAETTLEIPSGGTMALAGMIQQSTKQAVTGLPGLKDVPILGTLFRSRDYLKNETELVIFVTPYIARATSPGRMARPADGFADATDPSTIFLGQVNRIYGVDARDARGGVGFIVD